VPGIFELDMSGPAQKLSPPPSVPTSGFDAERARRAA
jgi:hypothetical protein